MAQVPAALRNVGQPASRRRGLWQRIKAARLLYLMLLPSLALLVVFRFMPLWGISIAFVDYYPLKGLAESPFVGLKHFEAIFGSKEGFEIIRNTLVIAVGKLIAGDIASIAFALLIFQLGHRLFKRIAQVTTAIPHFMSWVIIGGIFIDLLSSRGLVNAPLQALGLPAIPFLRDQTLFPITLILTDVWKEFGFGSVIYLAALTTILPELYEAAAVDGAGRLSRLIHITIPGIMPTIILMLCLGLGRVLDAGFEQVLTLLNPLVYSTGDIIDTYVYRVGLLRGDFSVGAAIGLFKSVVSFTLIMFSYWLADRYAGYRIF